MLTSLIDMSAKRISKAVENGKKPALSKQTVSPAANRPDMKVILKSIPDQLPFYVITHKPHQLAEGAD